MRGRDKLTGYMEKHNMKRCERCYHHGDNTNIIKKNCYSGIEEILENDNVKIKAHSIFIYKPIQLHGKKTSLLQTWVIKLWAPFKPSSSPVLNKNITAFLNPWAHWETPRASSSITATHELQSPAPSLKNRQNKNLILVILLPPS